MRLANGAPQEQEEAGNNSPHSRFLHSVICHRHPCQEVRPSRDSHRFLPHPLPIQNLPAPQPVIEPVESDVATAEQDDDAMTERLQGYASMWRNRTEKPLQQVYGHIDRIGSGDVGSLLDRYADRFGHDLDRDIIVLRQQEREEKLGRLREAPTVELVSEIETDGISEETGVPTTDERNEIEVQLAHLEDELRRLKPEFQEARDRNDRERIVAIHPVLKSMIEERKILKSI